MKKILALMVVLAASFALIAGGSQESSADDGTVLIGVSKLLSHAALDAVEVGMQDYLSGTGIPVRYAHTHYGISSVSDFANGIKLAKEIIRRLDKDTIGSF